MTKKRWTEIEVDIALTNDTRYKVRGLAYGEPPYRLAVTPVPFANMVIWDGETPLQFDGYTVTHPRTGLCVGIAYSTEYKAKRVLLGILKEVSPKDETWDTLNKEGILSGKLLKAVRDNRLMYNGRLIINPRRTENAKGEETEGKEES